MLRHGDPIAKVCDIHSKSDKLPKMHRAKRTPPALHADKIKTEVGIMRLLLV